MDTKRQRPSAHIQGLPDPLSEIPWSADFVMQAIEVLPVTYRGQGLSPCGRRMPLRS